MYLLSRFYLASSLSALDDKEVIHTNVLYYQEGNKSAQ